MNHQQQGRFLPAEFFRARTQHGAARVPNNPMNISPEMIGRNWERETLYGDTRVTRESTGMRLSRNPQQAPSAAGRGLTHDVDKRGDRLDMTTQIAMAGSGQRPAGDGKGPIQNEKTDHRRGINTSFRWANMPQSNQSA